jgi:hypothetical protein
MERGKTCGPLQKDKKILLSKSSASSAIEQNQVIVKSVEAVNLFKALIQWHYSLMRC